MKNKKIIFIVIAIIAIIVIGRIIFIVSDLGKKPTKKFKMTKEEMLQKAKIYNESSFNKSKAKDLNGKIYVYYGHISSISDNYVKLKNSYSGDVKAYLNSDVIRKLKEDEPLMVVGRVEDVSLKPGEIKNAQIVYDDEKEKYFRVDLVMEKGTKYPDYKYADFKYDDAGRKISYTASTSSGHRLGTYKLQYDYRNKIIEKKLEGISSNTVFTYTYTKTGNLEKHTEIDYKKDGSVLNENIFDHTTEVDIRGNIIKDNHFNVKHPEYKYEFTYEYDRDDKLIKETEYDFHSNKMCVSTYKYDNDDNKVSKTSKGECDNVVNYTYAIVGRK